MWTMTSNARIRRRSRAAGTTAPTGTLRQNQDAKSETYDIGYRKPPKATRFKPGKSGNPRGRPRGAKSLKNLIDHELSQKVVIRDEGGRHTVAKREVVAKQVVQKAVKGQDKAIGTVMRVDDERDAAAKAAAAVQAGALSPEVMDEEDKKLLAEIKQHLRDEDSGRRRHPRARVGRRNTQKKGN